MKHADLQDIVAFCDRLLRTTEIEDYSGAVNGLQVENRGNVTRVAAAVDASPTTVAKAAAVGADLLIVHHGLFWGPRQPWTGRNYQLLRLLLENNLAVYSTHLPLDLHPKLGNNALLAAALGFKRTSPFFIQHGNAIGLRCQCRIPRQELLHRLQQATGTLPHILPGGPEICHRIGMVSGGAGGDLASAAAEGIDTFITGEGPHWTYALAEELQVNVLYGGHYATETFGVKALAEHIGARFKLPWVFIDHPTGL